MRYGQFCPVAKAAEVLGERWTLLVMRELVTGATRYAEIKRGLGHISPSVLSTRLKALVDHGIVERVPGNGPHGWEYKLTPAGAELEPVIESIGVWGQRWVRSRMTRDELDVELLMLRVQRYFDGRAFQRDGVVGFVFSDLHGRERRWWLVVERGEAELCLQSPGRADAVTLTCRVRTLAEIFAGDLTLQAARATSRLELRGSARLVRSVHRWLRVSSLAAVAPAVPRS